jgi:hypothetical protein
MSSSKRRRTSSVGSSQRKSGEWNVLRCSDERVFLFVKLGSNDREIVVANLDSHHTEQDLRDGFALFGQIDRYKKKKK